MPYVDPTVACGPYVTPADLCCEGGADSIDCDGTVSPSTFKWTDEQIIEAATNLMFRRTCYRFPGLCARTVIPCICHQFTCECGKLDPHIVLTSDYPIHEVPVVTITEKDGTTTTLTPDVDYMLDENARLVRLGGDVWPTRRRAVTVQYVTGREAPIEVVMATAELACQLKAACEGTNCKLPSHVRSVARRGVEIEVNDVIALMSSGYTGLPLVDHVIATRGRCQHSRMFDPLRDHPEAVRVT